MTSCALSVALLARGAPNADMKLSIARRSGSFTALGALFEDGETGPFRPGFLDAGISLLLATFQENLKYNLIDSSIDDLTAQAVEFRPIRSVKTIVDRDVAASIERDAGNVEPDPLCVGRATDRDQYVAAFDGRVAVRCAQSKTDAFPDWPATWRIFAPNRTAIPSSVDISRSAAATSRSSRLANWFLVSTIVTRLPKRR